MANISEVAELAGVSVATVSRYFTAPEMLLSVATSDQNMSIVLFVAHAILMYSQ